MQTDVKYAKRKQKNEKQFLEQKKKKLSKTTKDTCKSNLFEGHSEFLSVLEI